MRERIYHVAATWQPKRNKVKKEVGRKKTIEMMPEDMPWKSLVNNGLCMGLQSPCVVGQCDVMCGYGRRYLDEKDQHAG